MSFFRWRGQKGFIASLTALHEVSDHDVSPGYSSIHPRGRERALGMALRRSLNGAENGAV
jgi:hypothetical protein